MTAEQELALLEGWEDVEELEQCPDCGQDGLNCPCE